MPRPGQYYACQMTQKARALEAKQKPYQGYSGSKHRYYCGYMLIWGGGGEVVGFVGIGG